MYPFWCADPDDLQMIIDGAKSSDGFRLGFVDHFFQGVIYQIHRKTILACISFSQLPVGFCNSCNQDIVLVLSLENPMSMIMRKSGYTNAQRSEERRVGKRGRWMGWQ